MLRWGATSEYRFKLGDFAPTGAGWPKIWGRRGHRSPTILLLIFSEKKAKWFFIRCKNLGIRFFLFVTNHSFDKQTEGQAEFSSLPRLHSMQRGKNGHMLRGNSGMNSLLLLEGKSMMSEQEAGQEGRGLTMLKNGVMWKAITSTKKVQKTCHWTDLSRSLSIWEEDTTKGRT